MADSRRGIGVTKGAGFPGGVVKAVLAGVLLTVASLAWASSASAVYIPTASFASQGSGNGELLAPGGAVVRQSDGMVFVADRGNDRVQLFSPSGASAVFDSQLTAPGLVGPADVAIDQETGAVYVSDADGIVKFTAALEQDVGFASPAVTGPIAFDQSSDELVVADQAANVVRRYSPAGVAGATFDGSDGTTAFTRLLDVAADSTGDVIVVDETGDVLSEFDASTVRRYSSAGSFETTIGPVFGAGSVSVDPDGDRVVVGEAFYAYSFGFFINGQMSFFDADGTPAGSVGYPSGPPVGDAHWKVARGIAPVPGSTRIYAVLDGPPGLGDASGYVFDDLLAPAATVEPATAVESHSATLHGSVETNGSDASYHFEYRRTGDATWTTTPSADIAGSGSPVAVQDDIDGIRANSEYSFRLIATNPGGESTSSEATFTTLPAPPVVEAIGAQVEGTTAVLRARVNPNDSATTYWFEYGASTAYGADLPATHDASAGNGPNPVGVRRTLYNLQPGQTYHYRVIATNSTGTVEGEDRSFTVDTPAQCPNARIREQQTSEWLPDCRAFELVSPADKGGGIVYGAEAQRRPGATAFNFDDGLVYVGSNAFPGTGAPSGMRIMSYLARRNQAGWANKAVAVPAPLNARSLPALALTSDDGDRQLMRVPADPATGEISTETVGLLMMRDLRTSEEKALTPAVPPGGGEFSTGVVDYTDDLSEVLLQVGGGPLIAGVPASTGVVIDTIEHGLYRYSADSGQITYEGVLPDGSLATGHWGASASSFEGEEAGGSILSDDGDVSFFTSSGVVYRRDDGVTEAVSVNEDTGTPAGSAVFRQASADGSRVFFTTYDSLVPEDGNSVGDLYLYDADRPVGDRVSLVSEDDEPADGDGLQQAADGWPSNQDFGVLWVSDDGRRVYFVGDNQLVAGGPTDGVNPKRLYLWDATSGAPELRYIALLGSADEQAPWIQDKRFDGLRQATADGGRLLFVTNSPGLIANSTTGSQVYVFDAEASGGQGDLMCVSCPPDGPATSRSVIAGEGGTAATERGTKPALSADGRSVVFETAQPLVVGDGNGVTDVYIWRDGDVRRLSRGSNSSSFMSASPDHSTVFIATAERLVGSDTDGAIDAYAVRVDGGFLEPDEVADCLGDACQPPVSLSAPQKAKSTAPSAGNVESRSGVARLAVVGLSARQRAVLARGGAVKLGVRVKGSGAVSLIARAKVGGRSRTVARARKRATGAGLVRLSVRLSSGARAQLRRSGRLTVALTVRQGAATSKKRVVLRLGGAR